MAVMITGTSRGIGSALLKEYKGSGVSTISLTRSDRLEVSMEGQHIRVGFGWDDFEALAKELAVQSEKIGFKVNVLINNAGLLVKDSIKEVRYEDFERQMRVNAWNSLALFRAMHSEGLFADGAHILNIGSMGGVQGAVKFPGLLAYSASKAALIAITEALDAEYGDEGLAFNCLALGAVNTEMLQEAFPGYVSKVDPENMAKYIRTVADESGRIMSGKLIQATKSNPEA
ncbi:MAG: SDR family oxidoreductase [Cryomorphaceae bacterium]